MFCILIINLGLFPKANYGYGGGSGEGYPDIAFGYADFGVRELQQIHLMSWVS